MTLKKLFRYLRVSRIDIFIYSMTDNDAPRLPEPVFRYTKTSLPDGKTQYTILDNGTFVHNSFVFPNLNVLKLTNRKGPSIGDCVTSPEYRGQSIYPRMINTIAHELLSQGEKEVFIIVNADNESSIKGIEKAGFSKPMQVRAKRWGFWYFGVNKTQ